MRGGRHSAAVEVESGWHVVTVVWSSRSRKGADHEQHKIDMCYPDETRDRGLVVLSARVPFSPTLASKPNPRSLLSPCGAGGESADLGLQSYWVG